MYMKTDFQVSKYTSARNSIIIRLQSVRVHVIIIVLRSQLRKVIYFYVSFAKSKVTVRLEHFGWRDCSQLSKQDTFF